ncbi:hypothetical protein [Siphonobacter sp.]|uniref:hypothetical protein n=1 Tax=Siphonobacter sp. TaxID=1869184 RepID=UPI003B39FB17
MADFPKYEDKVYAGSGGAILYSFSNGEMWNWDNKPVRLPEGEYLPATGNFSNNPTLGLMYEVYIYRVQGSSQVYRTKEEARNGVGLIVNFSKIVREQKWVVASLVRVDFNVSNQTNSPDPGSPVTQQQSEQTRLESELEKLVYGPNPAMPRHTSLAKNTEGKWMLTFQNGYTVDYTTFINLTPVERQRLVSVNISSGLTTTGTGTGSSTSETAGFPTWAYGIIGVFVLAVMGLFVLSSKPKSKR